MYICMYVYIYIYIYHMSHIYMCVLGSTVNLHYTVYVRNPRTLHIPAYRYIAITWEKYTRPRYNIFVMKWYKPRCTLGINPGRNCHEPSSTLSEKLRISGERIWQGARFGMGACATFVPRLPRMRTDSKRSWFGRGTNVARHRSGSLQKPSSSWCPLLYNHLE